MIYVKFSIINVVKWRTYNQNTTIVSLPHFVMLQIIILLKSKHMIIRGDNVSVSYDLDKLCSNEQISVAHTDLRTPYFMALGSEGIITGVRATVHLGSKVNTAALVYKSGSITLRHCDIFFSPMNKEINLKYAMLGKLVFDFSCTITAAIGGSVIKFDPYINGITSIAS